MPSTVLGPYRHHGEQNSLLPSRVPQRDKATHHRGRVMTAMTGEPRELTAEAEASTPLGGQRRVLGKGGLWPKEWGTVAKEKQESVQREIVV